MTGHYLLLSDHCFACLEFNRYLTRRDCLRGSSKAHFITVKTNTYTLSIQKEFSGVGKDYQKSILVLSFFVTLSTFKIVCNYYFDIFGV